MKIVIIGGGIAGIAAAISFRKKQIEAVVLERAPEFTEVGLGFILLPNGMAALDKLGAGDYIRQYGAALNTATLRDCSGRIVKTESLSNSIAVKRSVCIEALANQIPASSIKHGFDFSHFEFDSDGMAVAAISKNGDKETGDIFIAADGAGSKIRKQVFEELQMRDSVIRELVGIADAPELVQRLSGQLLKTQSADKGLSIGILPCNASQVIWYIQFDSRNGDLTSFDVSLKEAFAKDLVGNWPDPVNEVLNATNFNTAFLWHTRDMEVPQTFHKKNIVLLGDAAHLALPFTSQGTNSALTDAMILAELFSASTTLSETEGIFTQFHARRKEILNDYVHFGRILEKQFLNPTETTDNDVLIPLAL